MISSSRVGVDVSTDTFKGLPGTVALPPVRSERFISQRHEVNPALAFNLLKDIQSVVSVWHEQLRQVVHALHALHAQGPMVDGWLESSVQMPQPIVQTGGVDSTILRHGDAEALLQYVEALGSNGLNSSDHSKSHDLSPISQADIKIDSAESDIASAETETDGAPTLYHLCHLNESGQVVSQPCPPEQMGVVSMAIARHQKFRQLMDKKQAIEVKLQCAVDKLTSTRSALKEDSLM